MNLLRKEHRNRRSYKSTNPLLARALVLLTMSALTMSLFAQSKKQVQVMANARTLENTVFGTKDSATLEKLFASELQYIHSSGRVEDRQQAINGIIHNKSTYKKLNGPAPYRVSEKGDSLIVYQVYKATETKADGSSSVLSISIETVWAKEKGNWKLFRRQARKEE